MISAIKRKLGEPLLSKTQPARFNELLAYNIGVVVHQIYEHHIDPRVPGLRLPDAPPENSSAEEPVTKSGRLSENSRSHGLPPSSQSQS